tara:strand:+ start:5220 stop:6026 length:807 start_codon:yes stop_codon:yes gene_type:complete
MKDLKIQIILFYYDRPNLVKKMGLKTVFESDYDNWEISVIDDSNEQNFNKVLEEFYKDHPDFINSKDKVKIFNTNDTLEEKKQRGDAVIGKFANDAMYLSEADISIMLCDDDGVTKNYFSELSEFYIKNPELNHSYCRLTTYTPIEGGKTERKQGEWIEGGNTGIDYENFIPTPDNYLNCRQDNTRLENVCDSSMVSWRRENAIKEGILFKYPKTANLDSDIYSLMDRYWGNCNFNSIIGQYKAFWDGQLGHIQWGGQDVRYVATDID